MVWFRFQISPPETLVLAIFVLFVATFLDPVHCASTHLKITTPEKTEWQNGTSLIIRPSPEILDNSTKNQLQKFQPKAKRYHKILESNRSKSRGPTNNSNVSNLDHDQNLKNPRLKFQASQLLSVGLETTSSFKNGNNMENLIKYGYRHLPLGRPALFQPNLGEVTLKHNNFGMNSFNVMELGRETEYNAEGPIVGDRVGAKTGKKYKVATKSRQNGKSPSDERIHQSRTRKMVAKPKSERNSKTKLLSLGTNNYSHTDLPTNTKVALNKDPAINHGLTHFRYFFAQPPPMPLASAGQKEPLESENVQKSQVTSYHNQNKQPSGSIHNMSESPHTPSQIAGLVIVQLHSDGKSSASSSSLQLSPETAKQQIDAQTTPTGHNLPNSQNPSQPHHQYQANSNNVNVVHNGETEGNAAAPFLGTHTDYGSHSHSIPHSHPHSSHQHHHSSSEEMEFQEGKITISKVMLGSKSLKKGTGLVILATIIVTLIIAGVTASTGASLSPILFPLILLPIAILAFILFIPSILLFVPIVIAGLAGGQERRRVLDKGRDQLLDSRVENDLNDLIRLFAKIPHNY